MPAPYQPWATKPSWWTSNQWAEQNAVAGGVAPASNSTGALVWSSGRIVPTPTFLPSGSFLR